MKTGEGFEDLGTRV